jgi:hypothetical protein
MFYPRSPYAVGKVASYWAVSNYREAYGLFASGLLFNYESPLRPSRFVTQKIIRGAMNVSTGRTRVLHPALLRHKFRRMFRRNLRAQHGQRGSIRAIATTIAVAIELGMCRWGRSGGAAGSVTTGNGRFREHPGALNKLHGSKITIEYSQSVSYNASQTLRCTQSWREGRPKYFLISS